MTALATHRIVHVEAASAAAEPLRALDGLSVDDLRDLMESVTQTTQRLQTTHIALHDQVSRLQRELADARAALRRSEALTALGEMAAGIAHEIRNPLASIQLYAQMLGEDLVDRPPQAELCGKINRAVVTLDAIVRDVLSFAREARIDCQPTTSTELVDAALQSCAAVIAGNGVSVTIDHDSPLALTADVGRMTQALGNVIRNAIEAMTETDDVRDCPRQMRVWAQRRRWRDAGGVAKPFIALCVQDSGDGIPAEVRERIFNPFFTTRKTGTGLGLAIVHRIVDAHGGHINIENVKPRGTRIELCLPAGKHKAQSTKQRSADQTRSLVTRHSPSYSLLKSL